jgi:signal transduction histidine kinase
VRLHHPALWYAVERRTAGRARFDVVGLDPDERRPRKAAVRFPERFLAAHPFRSLLVLCADSGGTWVNRLLLFDARVGARELRFLQTIAREVGPAIYNVELLGRLRSRVGAAERARLARDLDDGIIQSLIGLEMQVDVWRRQAAEVDEAVASRFAFIQESLRNEVLDLRDLMQQMKPASIDPVRAGSSRIAHRAVSATAASRRISSRDPRPDVVPAVLRGVVRIVRRRW